MPIQKEVLNWALPSHHGFKSRCGKETPLFRHQNCIYAITKHFRIGGAEIVTHEQKKNLKKFRVMHIYQQLPSQEWKLYPNVLGEN